MDWNDTTQRRFDALRQQELTGPLSADEQHELDALRAILLADEARYLAPAIARDEHAAQELEHQLAALQTQTEALATLARQHEQLLSEARTWLTGFEQRRQLLHERYAQLTGKPLPIEPGR